MKLLEFLIVFAGIRMYALNMLDLTLPIAGI